MDTAQGYASAHTRKLDFSLALFWYKVCLDNEVCVFS